MARRSRFTLLFAPEAIVHLDGIERKYHRLLRSVIDQQLTSTPDVQARNRKPVEQPAPFGATWELRCGTQNRFRVFYEINAAEAGVDILAIGTKDRNRLFFSGKEFEP